MLEAKDIKWNNAIVKVIDRADASKERLTLALEPMRRLEVLVRNNEGSPLQGAKVWLSENWKPFSTSKSCLTDDSGIATFDRVFPGGVYWMPGVELEGYSLEKPKGALIAGGPEWKDRLEIVMEKASEQ